ncbi:MAG: DMT family transporter [Granulosicoccus sp.]
MSINKSGGILLILSAAILWGTTGTAQSFSPLTLSSYWVGTGRLLVSTVFFIIWIALTDIGLLRATPLKTMPWPLILAAAVTMASYNLAFFAGVRTTSVAIGTAVALGSGPVWAGIIQAIWNRQLPDKAWWFAVIIAVTGLLIATLGSSSSFTDTPLSGIALCLLSGLSYAVYALITKQLVTTASASLTTAMVFTGAAAMALPAAFLLAGSPDFHPTDFAVMLWLGVVATGVAYLLFSIGLRYVSSKTGVALALAEPIAAVILAIVIVGERPTTLSLTGLSIVFLGLCLIIRTELKQAAKH